MLQPKRTKFRKAHKGGSMASQGRCRLSFGAMVSGSDAGTRYGQQIEAARRTITVI